MSTLLEVKGLTKTFGDRVAVDDLSLTIEPGQLYALVGPDGAGKTTSLRMMVGLMNPSAGAVRVLGEDPARSSAAVRAALGYMPQRFALYGDLSVDENLAFFAEMHGLDRATYRERRQRLLDLTRLAPFGARRADALSGGMYKKLALACALLPRPSLLLLDEPTNGVDPVSRRELWRLLFELCGEGLAVLISTAYLDEASRGHRIGVLDRGRMLLEGPPLGLGDDARRRGLPVEGDAPEAVIVSALRAARQEAA
jgi:ABC-2 type transport system ATP-binding protein